MASKRFATLAMRGEMERRRLRRYPIKYNDVYITFRPNFETMGTVRDISGSGVCFEYMAKPYYSTVAKSDIPPLLPIEQPEVKSFLKMEGVEVDIFSRSHGFHVAKVTCKVAYDVLLDSQNSFLAIQNRRCGLAFESLNDQQATRLNIFLNQLE